MEKKLNTWKEKLSNNAGEITFWAVMGAGIAAYAVLIGYSVKKQGDALQDELDRAHELRLVQETAKEAARARGALVLPNGENDYWIIEQNGRVG
jgi:hypothetical protein